MTYFNWTKRPFNRVIPAAFLAVLGFGCTESVEESVESASHAVRQATMKEDAMAGFEHALRDVDLGKNLDQSRKVLESVLEDSLSSDEMKGDARLGLSRVLELQGDGEGAIQQVEALLASLSHDTPMPSRSLAEKRLRKLLTGKEWEPRQLQSEHDVPPMAVLLAKQLKPKEDGSYESNVLILGQPPEESAELGTFDMRGALHRIGESACPLCDIKISLSQTRSQYSSWTSLPMVASPGFSEHPTLATSLTVLYYDLEHNQVPGRYDAHLPIPSEKVASLLTPEQGMVVVKLRPGAPPIVLIAAPRWALLSEVEEVFSNMTEFPTEPKLVPLGPNLRAKEIRSAVRASNPSFRKCYEDLLQKQPDADGKLVLGFEIEGDGTVEGARIEEESTLRDQQLHRCFVDVVRGLSFPALGGKTTVRYPIELRPR